MLAEQAGKRVNVLIDSLGGSLATGLSISAAFKNHGDVAVHFVGLNASAATIASLGVTHISIHAGAMYLVHKCSMAFFEWGSLNSDQFTKLIQDIEKVKADLDKLDLNVAQLYARKCRKPTAGLLALMKQGGWLTAKEALEWGFVDEITDLADEPAPSSPTPSPPPWHPKGRRLDHETLPDEIRARFTENLSILQRMRELHLRLRTLSDETTTCPDSDRFPFLKEMIALDKKLHANWKQYDTYVAETP